MHTIADAFAEHGADSVARVRTTDPIAYLKIVGSLVPRELILQREESPRNQYRNNIAYIDDRRRQTLIEGVLKGVG